MRWPWVVNQAVLEQYWPCHIALLAEGSDVRVRKIRIIPSSPGRHPGSSIAGAHADRNPDASPAEGAPFHLVNVKPGKALDVKDGSMLAGAALM
jgi:hypothetical protein